MNSSLLRIALTASKEQQVQLLALQKAFAQVCNALAPIVQQTRCWNRVTLHHLAYKSLRERFPAMGSQMVCNAIYSVSRTARAVFQHPQSPLHLSRLGDAPLPLLEFAENSPVYFDRHTVSVKAGMLSMYTLDGRMRFNVSLSAHDEERFHTEKLRELVLNRDGQGNFELCFSFAAEDAHGAAPEPALPSSPMPPYVRIELPR